jgi:hypothetical protein
MGVGYIYTKDSTMKKIITICIGFILFLLISMFLASCTPSMYVNPASKHNYYNRYRAETYTSPTWIPGVGIVLETPHIIPKYRNYQPRYVQPRALRGKH